METACAQLWWPWLLVCTSVATGSHHGGKSSSGGCDKHQASSVQAPCWKGWLQVWAWWWGSAAGVQAGISHSDRRLCVRILGPGRGREEETGKDSGWVPADAATWGTKSSEICRRCLMSMVPIGFFSGKSSKGPLQGSSLGSTVVPVSGLMLAESALLLGFQPSPYVLALPLSSVKLNWIFQAQLECPPNSG